MATGERIDSYLNFRFLVELDGLIVAGFSDVTGLDVQIETEEYQEGGLNELVHQLPKGTRSSKLVLKRGITDSDVLWKWQQEIIDGEINRKTIRIVLLDTEGHEKLHWLCSDAHPVRWTGPELQGTGNSVAIESLELVYASIKWKKI